jgi:death-on-curing family protein
MQKGEIEIYRTGTGAEIEVRLHGDSVWMDAHLVAKLFGVNRPAIVKHIHNIYITRELERKSTCSVLEQVAADGRKRKMNLYNLDVIISVGYRVNSGKATRFRQWATQRLKDHLIKGYTVNQKRLEQLCKTVQLIEKGGQTESLSISEAKGLLEIISNYTQSFVLLNRFDSNTLSPDRLNQHITYEIKYPEAVEAINQLKGQLIRQREASELFGRQKDDSFAGILGSIVQTFGGEYLYKSIEEQAAHLLYFVIKNHPFSDGNKRIGAFLFIWFLEKNKHRFKQDGELKINDNGLVALALLVAQSDPAEKELMISLIINLINSR